jgi:hypothetical protein
MEISPEIIDVLNLQIELFMFPQKVIILLHYSCFDNDNSLVQDRIKVMTLICHSGTRQLRQSHNSKLGKEITHKRSKKIKIHEQENDFTKKRHEVKERNNLCNPTKDVFNSIHYNCYSKGSSLAQDQLKFWAAKRPSGSQSAMLGNSSKRFNKRIHQLLHEEKVIPQKKQE